MSDTQIQELRNPPAMAVNFAKAVLSANRKPGKSPQLPDFGLRLSDVVLDPGHLARYRKVCGFQSSDHLPITYPHMHAFPLHMAMILDKRFPFPAMGLVHTRNQITQYRPIGEKEQLDVECRTGELERLEKGWQFSIITSVSTAGEPVWESESFMFFRTGGGSGNKSKKEQPKPEPVTGVTEWHVPGDMGRRYAGVSGDRNPIHLYPLTAKLFGFKRHIVHGMWSKARCLAELEKDFPKGPFTVDVQFKLPLFIPAKVKFDQRSQGEEIDFRLLAADGIKPHLAGQLRPLAD
jgi:hypothetical protein